MRAPALLLAAALLATPLAACDSSSQSQASADLKQAGDKTERGLKNLGDAATTQAGIAADRVQPALDHAGDKLQAGADKLADAAGRAAQKAGDAVETAGDRAQAKAERDQAIHDSTGR